MTDREALRTIFDFFHKNTDSINPIETFNIGEAVGTLSRMVDERCREIKEQEERQKQNEKSCGTCKHVMLIDCGAYPCNECPRDTLPKWDPKQTDATDMNDGNIKVGDEIYFEGYEDKRVVTNIDDGIICAFSPNSSYVVTHIENIHKTGRNFPQIAEVLEQLKGDI